MNNIKLGNNKIKILINDDTSKFIEFNPSDFKFVKRLEETYTKIKSLEVENNVDSLINACKLLDNEINDLFGDGKAEIIFEGQMDIDLYKQFFDGLLPFVEKASQNRVAKYLNK